jgi:hypothetical protein
MLELLPSTHLPVHRSLPLILSELLTAWFNEVELYLRGLCVQ